MQKLKVKIINYIDIFKNINTHFNHSSVQEYLDGGRQDILENFDIFTENIRSKSTEYKNFDLFDIVDTIDSNTVIVLGFYLELFEFFGQRIKIKEVIHYYSNKYPNNKIIATWNHDIDANTVFNFIEDYKNIYILNFNTSVKHPQYIVLPFWTINDKFIKEEKKYFLNLVCSFNNEIRLKLKNSLKNIPNSFISSNVDILEYRKILSSSFFTLCPRGHGLSSYRFFECFHLNTIPVLFADSVVLPYENEIDYNKIIVKIDESKCFDSDYIINKLNQVNCFEILDNIEKIRKRFTLLGIQTEINKIFYDSSYNN